MPSSLASFDGDRPYVSRRQQRAIEAALLSTEMQVADVRASSIVQGEKMREVDRLAREAASGQAMLHHWAATLSKGDPFLADELQHFVSLARAGKSELIVNTIERYSRGR